MSPLIQEIEEKISNIDQPSPNNSFLRLLRRGLRYKLFLIRNGNWAEDIELQELKKWYESQWQEGWCWVGKENGFTFAWDISVLNPLRAISPFEWDGNYIQDNNGKKMLDPSGFTKQE